MVTPWYFNIYIAQNVNIYNTSFTRNFHKNNMFFDIKIITMPGCYDIEVLNAYHIHVPWYIYMSTSRNTLIYVIIKCYCAHSFTYSLCCTITTCTYHGKCAKLHSNTKLNTYQRTEWFKSNSNSKNTWHYHDIWPKTWYYHDACLKKHGTLIVQNDYHIHIYMIHDQNKTWYYHETCLKKHGTLIVQNDYHIHIYMIHDQKKNVVLSWNMSKKTWYFDSTEWLPHSYLHDTWPKKNMVLSWCMSKKTWYFDSTEWLPHSYLHDTWPKKNVVLSWNMSKKTWYFDTVAAADLLKRGSSFSA